MDNKMTFFSGTDTGTLQSEGDKRNHFVSLIVNNAGTYTAGITRKVEIERTIVDKCSFRSYEDTLWELCDNEQNTQTFSEIQWVEFEIDKATVSNDCSELDERIAEIRKRKAAKPTKVCGEDFEFPKGRKFRQLSLFDDELDSSKVDFMPSLREGDKELERIIQSYFLQLITGAVTIADESKINVDRWASSMEALFDRRFGGTKNYKVWAESFCEFLVMYPAPKYEDVDEFEYACYIADGLIRRLKKLKENRYINTLIGVLASWTVE